MICQTGALFWVTWYIGTCTCYISFPGGGGGVLAQYATACGETSENLDTQMCDLGNKGEKSMIPVLTSRVNELTCKLLTISEAFWSKWVNCSPYKFKLST